MGYLRQTSTHTPNHSIHDTLKPDDIHLCPKLPQWLTTTHKATCNSVRQSSLRLQRKERCATCSPGPALNRTILGIQPLVMVQYGAIIL